MATSHMTQSCDFGVLIELLKAICHQHMYFYEIMLYQVHLITAGKSNSQLSVVVIDRCKSNYYTITSIVAPHIQLDILGGP